MSNKNKDMQTHKLDIGKVNEVIANFKNNITDRDKRKAQVVGNNLQHKSYMCSACLFGPCFLTTKVTPNQCTETSNKAPMWHELKN